MATARCRTLSSKVGMPLGRVCDPSPFGMWTRRTGGARYVPDLARSSSDWRFSSRFAAYSFAVCPSTPTAPSLRVRRYASFSQSMSMCWASVVNAISGACLASFAIRSSFVQTVVEPDVSSIFPSSGSVSRHPLPSTGSLGSVPPLRRYYGNARTPGHPSRLASFPSLGATTVRPLLSPLPPAWGATLQGRGLSRGSPSRSVGGNGWASQVPGGPSRACPALRPRRDRHAKPLRRVDVAFRNFGTRRLPPLSISGLNHTACALAVYASQPGSPLDHARLASGWGLALAGRVWLPARSLVKFPHYFMASSSPRLPWRIQNSIVTLDEGLAARDAGAQCPSLSLYWVPCAPPSGPARISHSRTSRCEATRPAPPSLDATAVRTPRSRFLGVPLSPLGRVARGAPCRSP